MTYSEPRSICFVLFNIRIPAAHSAFILSHLSLGLTLLPSCLIVTCRGQLVAAAGFGTYLVASGCTYGLGTVSFHSFSLSVSFAAVSISVTYRLAPWLLTVLSDLNKCWCLLSGIAHCTSLGVCVRGWTRTTASQRITDLTQPTCATAATLNSAALPTELLPPMSYPD